MEDHGGGVHGDPRWLMDYMGTTLEYSYFNKTILSIKNRSFGEVVQDKYAKYLNK